MIYFIQAEGVGHIKIGFTDKEDAALRLAELQVGSPVKLTLLGTVPGDKATEMDLHRQFGHAHCHGEWFKPCAELLSIAQLGALGGPDRQDVQRGPPGRRRVVLFLLGASGHSGARPGKGWGRHGDGIKNRVVRRDF